MANPDSSSRYFAKRNSLVSDAPVSSRDCSESTFVMTRIRPALAAAIVCLVTSLLSAAAFVAANNWIGVGDLSAMIAWSLPLAGLIYVAFSQLVVRLSRMHTAWLYVTLTLVGAAAGIVWTIVAALLLGGWIAAFSFPVLFCWVSSGLASGIACVWMQRPRSWPLATVVIVSVAVALLQLGKFALAPEPVVDVVLAPGTTQADEERFWMDVIGQRTGRTPTEHTLLDGISAAGISAYEAGRPVITVRFNKRLSRKRRDSLIARIQRAPIVARVDTLRKQ